VPNQIREEIAELWLAAAEGAEKNRHTLRQVVLSGLVILSRQLNHELWGRVQFALGNALRSLGELDDDAAVLREAVTAYRMALRERTRDRAPLDWAFTQNSLGIAMTRLGGLAADRAVLCEAITAYRLALEEYTRKRAPLDWAGTQTNLGNTLLTLGNLDGDPGLLRDAIAAHRMAFEEFTREHAPMEWAGIQINLGNVLQSLGDLDGDAAVLREAVGAYRLALEEYTRERAPLGWALTQYNLGGVLQSLGVLIGDAAVLREAVGAYRMALEERTREQTPIDWAATQNNLGLALDSLGYLAGDDEVLGEAISAFRAVLKEFPRGRHPEQWARTQENLGIALQHLGEFNGDNAVLHDAVIANRAVLEERTRERAPLEWAKTQYNIGNALQRLGVRAGDAARLNEAIIAYRAALEEFTRERSPVQWAQTQNNLGHALARLCAHDGDSGVLGEAIITCQMALEVFDAAHSDEDQRQGIAQALARLLVRFDRYDEAAAVIDPTLARSDVAIMDAARSRDGRARAVEQVGELYSLKSLCQWRQEPPAIAAALVTAEAGRARLLADALAFDERRIEDLPSLARREIYATRDKRDRLRHQLGFTPVAAWAGGTMTAAAGAMLRRASAPDERSAIEAELRQATGVYLSLCRRHGLIAAPEPLSYGQILMATPVDGALVMPVVTETRALAFVVAGGKAEVIELRKLDRQVLMRHLNDGWLRAYYAAVRSSGFSRQSPAYQEWNGQIVATQAWLWEVLLEPIDAYLRGEARLKKDAPAVLLPPGLLGLLPLQAAGPGADGRYFCEHWTVSVAPSVKSLIACRQRLADRRQVPAKLLAVIDPPGLAPLAGARAEGAMLRQRFAGAKQAILEGEDAKLRPVMQHLPSATYVHPSTHGMHHPRLPQLSELHLADIPLRLEMLHDTRLEAARLVFLSACESGLAGVRKMPEEFIGLPAGFVQAGAAAVAGSLWPVFDDAAFLLSSKFYERHLNEEGNERLAPAAALRQAQHWLRHVTYGDLKAMFPVKRDAAGAYLELYEAPRGTMPEEIRPFSLTLGPDDIRPYAAPHEWAAFTLTGA
jgi:CHAT domain-containing protein